jgi:hypothetical protein
MLFCALARFSVLLRFHPELGLPLKTPILKSGVLRLYP